MSDRVLVNALQRELRAADDEIAAKLAQAGATLRIHGGQATSPRVAAQQVRDSLSHAIEYYDKTAEKLRQVQHQNYGLAEMAAL